ncbi:DUF4240 domain-containing protein [Nonomuraea sp. NPDC001831]|uniref:DUF4240 domain-containing protein n=1 Tax=Nonomuraea sp. NPDC001831 TaxID=3364340 RepID=UPI00367567C7
MDIDGFWDLVERSAQETATRQERVSWLEEHLSRLSAEEIVDYEAWFTLCANRACTWDMYAACWTITGFGSSDGFEYFVDWLISLGRDAFGKVTECPDRLVELPEVQRLFELSRNFSHERTSASKDGAVHLVRLTRVRRQRWPDENWPEFESFAYAACHAYERVIGQDTAHPAEAVQARGITSAFPFLSFLAEPEDEAWDFNDRAEYTRRLPRLARHYGITEEPREHDEPSSARTRHTPWPYGPAWGEERTRAWSFQPNGSAGRRTRERRHRSYGPV